MSMLDSRKKTCPNDACEAHKKKTKFSTKDMYCKECGSRLVFVCKRCGKEIVDEGPKHAVCPACEAKAADRRERAKELAKKAATPVVFVATAAVQVVKDPDKVKDVVTKIVNQVQK